MEDQSSGNDSNEDDGVVSWKVCATVYGMYPSDTSNYTQVAQDDKGTCAGYLNVTCVEALRSAAAESFAANRTCQYKTIPDVCLMGDMGTPGEPGEPGWSAYENATIGMFMFPSSLLSPPLISYTKISTHNFRLQKKKKKRK